MPTVPFTNIGTTWTVVSPSGIVGEPRPSADNSTIRLSIAPQTDWWRTAAGGAAVDAGGKDDSSGPALVVPVPPSAEGDPNKGGFRAEVGFKGAWRERYDQAGLILFQRLSATTTSDKALSRWIKTGIELENGAPHLSVVVADPYSDWSLAPSPTSAILNPTETDSQGSLRISLERRGPHVIIGTRVDNGPLSIMREVRGFAVSAASEGEWFIGIAGNRPWVGDDGLEVEFERFELETL